MTTHQELAEEAIEDEFPRVLEWIDYDVQCAIIKAIYNAVRLKNESDVLVFAKSLVNEINSASIRYTECDFEAIQEDMTSLPWTSLRAMDDAGHKPGDFA